MSDGYAATTVAAIAADAGVSVDTIYKSFRGKSGLVQAICDEALAGAGPVHAEVRSDQLQATEPDPREIIRGWSRLAMEVAPRGAPLLLLLRSAAASDPELAAVLHEIDDRRLQRMTHNARTLLEGGHLRDGITLCDAADILWTCSSQELYELLVVRRGWSLEAFARFTSDTMIAALLPANPRADHR
jgi:AcrR family transcriptional regulator